MRHGFEAVARRDKEAWAAGCDPDLVAVPTDEWPESQVQGRGAVWDFLMGFESSWEARGYSLAEVTDASEGVVVNMRADLRGVSSGVEVSYDYWVVFSFRQDRVCRVEWFNQRDQALAAAGLPAPDP